MEKSKKKFGAKIAAALVAVTALTCCFVGSTFARYTSSTEAAGTVTVANWKIKGISENATPVNAFTFTATGDAMLSPAIPNSGDVSTSGLKNVIQSTAIEIKNESEVDAKLTWAWKAPAADASIYSWLDSKSDATEYKAAESGSSAITYKDLADGALKWSISYSTTETGTYTEWTDGAVAQDLETGASLWVKVTLTWETGTGDDRDTIDTILGMYLEKVVNTLTLTATQASQLPTA